LAERIQSYLNPLDFLLWLSEEIDANDWDQFEKDWALPLGVVLNVVFLIARANSRSNGSIAIDDVFGDDGGVPWLSWLVGDLSYRSVFRPVWGLQVVLGANKHHRRPPLSSIYLSVLQGSILSIHFTANDAIACLKHQSIGLLPRHQLIVSELTLLP
jgi:hypothetical protein